jgi:hypothetical protein
MEPVGQCLSPEVEQLIVSLRADPELQACVTAL